MAMDGGDREKILSRFQACVRGYLVRREVRRAQEDFEGIVREIDGGLSHLRWMDRVIPMPRFTDTDNPFPPPSCAASRPSDPGLDGSAGPQNPGAASALSQERGGDRGLPPGKTEAERDDAHLSRECFPSSHAGGDGEGQRQRGEWDPEGGEDGGVMESTGGSTTVWSSLEPDVNDGHSYQGPQQYGLAYKVPHTPQALHLHRNTLTMELVWLQQAIDSRKKYLSLKDKLTIS